MSDVKQLVITTLNEEMPSISPSLLQHFGVKDLMPNVPKSNSYWNAILYFMGVLTLAGRTALQHYILMAPNLATRQLCLALGFDRLVWEEVQTS